MGESNGGAPDQVPPAPPVSRITITFAGPGAADHQVALDGVVPAQVYAAAWLLDQLAREVRAGQVASFGGLVTPRSLAGLPPMPRGR